MKSMTVTPPNNNISAQIIDANLDRAREGIRVIEDWCRFTHLNNEFVVVLKDWRHQLSKHHHYFYREARNTSNDKGLGLSHPSQNNRANQEDVLLANASRIQEALRVIEEFSRNSDPELAKVSSDIRYGMYELESNLIRRFHLESRKLTLKECSLYLITSPNKNIKEIVLEALKAGVKMVQYRCKEYEDRRKLEEGKELLSICKRFESILIVNDRIDIALAINADGVHLGQNDVPVSTARRLLGEEKIIGLSTHCLRDIQDANNTCCDYVGLGPVFKSKTKETLDPIGTKQIKELSKKARVPSFAIGGIDLSNINELILAGANQIAVSNAIIQSNQPGATAKEMLDFLS